jgi:SSS family solute:Na+ symporter
MTRWVLVTIVIGIYLVANLVIGLMAGRRSSKSVTGFVAADRNFGLLIMYFVTGATIFSSFAFLGAPGWAYSRGAAAFYILAYGVLGMAPLYWMGPRIAALGRRLGHVTQAQLISGRFPSRTLSALIAAVSVAAFIPYITLQIEGAGIVINSVTDGHIPLWLGGLLAYGIVVVYVLVSGVSAVGWTNTFQGVFMVVIAWALGIYLPFHLYGGIGPMFERIAQARPELLIPPGLTSTGTHWGWGSFSSYILISVVGFLMWPHLFMKAYTAKDDDTLRRTVILFPTFQLFLIPILLIGFSGVLFPQAPADPDSILPFLILRTQLPSLVVGLFCAGALAASMSTGDALLHASASILVEDGIAPFARMSDRARRRLMRWLVLVTGAVAYWLAQTNTSSLVQLLASAYGIIAQLAPAVFAALYWRRATTAGVLSGLVAGGLATEFFRLYPAFAPFGIHEGILGLIVQVPVLVAVSLLTRPQRQEHLNAFFPAGSAQTE